MKYLPIAPIGQRKQVILKAIVTDYVRTAEPVGSHMLMAHHSFGIRSATIRSEMAELSEQSRREFISKIVAAAGAVAVAGLAGSAGSAQADTVKISGANTIKIDEWKDIVSMKIGKLRNGFRLSMTGHQIGEALKQAGVLTDSADMEKATITIEFSA